MAEIAFGVFTLLAVVVSASVVISRFQESRQTSPRFRNSVARDLKHAGYEVSPTCSAAPWAMSHADYTLQDEDAIWLVEIKRNIFTSDVIRLAHFIEDVKGRDPKVEGVLVSGSDIAVRTGELATEQGVALISASNVAGEFSRIIRSKNASENQGAVKVSG